MVFVDQVRRGDPRLRWLGILFFCGLALLLAGLAALALHMQSLERRARGDRSGIDVARSEAHPL